MTNTPNLKMPTIQAAQSQKHVTHNEALTILDSIVHLSVLDRTLQTPPALPVNGDRYIVSINGTDEWSGQDHTIAVWQENSWNFLNPETGWTAWVVNENNNITWDGTDWILSPVSVSEINNLDLLGIQTTADASNKLSVTSPSVLFNHESGDIRVIVNKDTATNTASLIFQTGFSGRIEIGSAGSDDLQIRVSADGVSWNTAMQVDPNSAEVHFETPLSLPSYLISTLPSVLRHGSLIYVSNATGGGVVAFSDGTNWKRINDNSIID